LLRGPWEDSFEERRDSVASDGVLFSPERKEGLGGFKQGQGLEDGDLFSPVRLHFGRFAANELGSDNNEKTVSGTTQESESEEETPNGVEARGRKTQRIAQRSAVQGGGRGREGNQTTSAQCATGWRRYSTGTLE
jgi:hypothetical protein